MKSLLLFTSRILLTFSLLSFFILCFDIESTYSFNADENGLPDIAEKYWNIKQTSPEKVCIIKSGMSPKLASYIKTTESLLSKIMEEAGKTQCNNNPNGENSTSASMNQVRSVTMGSFNEALGFSNFYTSIEFFTLSMFWSPPPAILRDHTRLWKELERIRSTIDMVYGQCAGNIPIGNILKEDTTYNGVSGGTLGEVLTEVLKNQVTIMNAYRGIVTGTNITEPKLILVWESKDFYADLKENYGKQNWYGIGGACESNMEMEFQKAFVRIGSGGENISDGMKNWSDAAGLLTGGSDTDEYKKTEKDLLKNELSKQGMSTKSSEVIMNNLKEYNDNYGNEGALGFIKSVGDRIKKSWDQFTNIYNGEDGNGGIKNYLAKMWNSTESTASTDEIMNKTQNNAIIIDIYKEIHDGYISTKSLIGMENQSTDETVAKLLDTHLLLEETNKLARSYIKIAEQTCDGQSKGKGNCKF